MFPLVCLFAWAVSSVDGGDILREEGPLGLSGITWAGGTRYYAVNDSDGCVSAIDLRLDATNGTVQTYAARSSVRLEGAKDLEGCAFDPLRKTLWASDECNTTLDEFDLKTGKRCGSVPIPRVVRESVRENFSLESATIAPDGLTLWTANEEALECDGERSNDGTGTVVRLMRFVRADASSSWRAAGDWRYETERLSERYNPTRLNRCGVSDLAALPDGSLIVLEREFSGAVFKTRLYHVAPNTAPMGSRVVKTLLHSTAERYSFLNPNERVANYEGLCLGPVLPDGSRTLILIADAGDRVMTYPRICVLRIRKRAEHACESVE